MSTIRAHFTQLFAVTILPNRVIFRKSLDQSPHLNLIDLAFSRYEVRESPHPNWNYLVAHVVDVWKMMVSYTS